MNSWVWSGHKLVQAGNFNISEILSIEVLKEASGKSGEKKKVISSFKIALNNSIFLWLYVWLGNRENIRSPFTTKPVEILHTASEEVSASSQGTGTSVFILQAKHAFEEFPEGAKVITLSVCKKQQQVKWVIWVIQDWIHPLLLFLRLFSQVYSGVPALLHFKQTWFRCVWYIFL